MHFGSSYHLMWLSTIYWCWQLGFDFSNPKPGQKPRWSHHFGPAWPGLFGLGLAWLTAWGRAKHITSIRKPGISLFYFCVLFCPFFFLFFVFGQFQRKPKEARAIILILLILWAKRQDPLLAIDLPPLFPYLLSFICFDLPFVTSNLCFLTKIC